ncbi:hypothetical protein [Nodularia spumigena]|jgi:hypothetical protein|nr:hypothetical protein [Nodularia spumigena]MEA5523594.1 hypothetical protein [Nodularia spumigena UHCC 0143]MEA5555757.1 hypothetical protein [Nodularia spumigena CH309]MEA5607162.1 hypothetical protein [Nodularia spumigena UHCC 0060]
MEKKRSELSALEKLPDKRKGRFYGNEDFILKFQDLYPNDWQKIVARYEAHEKLTPKGKSHPMPKPEKYLLNISYKLRTAYAKGEMLSSVVQESETED